ncbi:Crp/Fnr family transcriptional regulator [Neptuniibacter sp. QD29_5]|uniref:Crp/Fnr family transcriptional regulator n=1 Tax=Neptuniibacter sp. QD29_5 TaxID=3398207 RepID=UPI0039F5CAA8
MSHSKIDLLSNRSKEDTPLDEKCQLLDASAWGREFSYEHIQYLAEHMDLYQLKKGESLFSEGEKCSYFVLIIKGQLDVLKKDDQNKLKKIVTLRAGNTIGEMGLIDNETRSATVVAATDISVLVMTTEGFKKMCEARPRVALELVMRFAKQISQHLRMTTGKLVDYLE